MIVSTASEFVEYWTGFRRRTRRAAEAVPADRLEWRPAPPLSGFTEEELRERSR
jgi:hypothetical protein